MDRYLYVQSDESNTYFDDNTTTRFRVQLQFPLDFPGVWKVALVEFHAAETSKSSIKADEGLYIYADLCKESIVYGEERPLLRRLKKSSRGKWDYILDTPFYLPVSKHEVRDFEIYIKGERDEDISHLVKPVRLTLHFKHYPFW
jgi:hypothetical protein